MGCIFPASLRCQKHGSIVKLQVSAIRGSCEAAWPPDGFLFGKFQTVSHWEGNILRKRYSFGMLCVWFFYRAFPYFKCPAIPNNIIIIIIIMMMCIWLLASVQIVCAKPIQINDIISHSLINHPLICRISFPGPHARGCAWEVCASNGPGSIVSGRRERPVGSIPRELSQAVYG